MRFGAGRSVAAASGTVGLGPSRGAGSTWLRAVGLLQIAGSGAVGAFPLGADASRGATVRPGTGSSARTRTVTGSGGVELRRGAFGSARGADGASGRMLAETGCELFEAGLRAEGKAVAGTQGEPPRRGAWLRRAGWLNRCRFGWLRRSFGLERPRRRRLGLGRSRGRDLPRSAGPSNRTLCARRHPRRGRSALANGPCYRRRRSVGRRSRLARRGRSDICGRPSNTRGRVPPAPAAAGQGAREAIGRPLPFPPGGLLPELHPTFRTQTWRRLPVDNATLRASGFPHARPAEPILPIFRAQPTSKCAATLLCAT